MSPSDVAAADQLVVHSAAMAVAVAVAAAAVAVAAAVAAASSESATTLSALSAEWRRRFHFSHGVFVPFTARIASAGSAPPASSDPLLLTFSS